MINLGKLFFLNSKKNFLQEEKEEKVTYNWCHAISAPLQIVMNIYFLGYCVTPCNKLWSPFFQFHGKCIYFTNKCTNTCKKFSTNQK